MTVCVGLGGLKMVSKVQGGSGRSGRFREDPEESIRFREGPGVSGRIQECPGGSRRK